MDDSLKLHYNRIKLGGKNYLRVILDEETDLLDAIAGKLAGDTDIIELSGRSVSSGYFLNIAKNVKLLCAQFDKTFIIDERLDIAYLTDADGIFLSASDIDFESARRLLSPNTIIGTYYESLTKADYYLLNANQSCQTSVPCFLNTETCKHFVCFTHLK